MVPLDFKQAALQKHWKNGGRKRGGRKCEASVLSPLEVCIQPKAVWDVYLLPECSK